MNLSKSVLIAACSCLLTLPPQLCGAQELPEQQFQNADLEEVLDGIPSGWFFASQSGGKLVKDEGSVFSGERAWLIDASESDANAPQVFANLAQTIDAVNYRGKRVRFRAAVKTADLAEKATVNLWFRVDLKGLPGQQAVGAFDNMMDRPIRTENWKKFDVVLDVDQDAVKIVVGCFVSGVGKAWIDAASLEEVSDDVPTTDGTIRQFINRKSDDDESEERKTKETTPFGTQGPSWAKPLQLAFQEADQAPQQPFFNHWFWLFALALILFGLSAWPARATAVDIDGVSETRPVLGVVPKFAFRFSFLYWICYSFPFPLANVAPKWTATPTAWYTDQKMELVHWVALRVFGIEDGQLVLPNGSGDTTFSYITVFVVFIVALLAASIWTAIDWRRTDHRYLKDGLRSYLRYVIAFWMLSYGLAKVSWDFNQFPLVSEFQLSKSWSDSSPMNVVWAFMGTSRAYTVFAGSGEVLGAMLLIWRRTSLLGAMVVLGVMTNVMMLNYCYDVPVKVFSTHLVVMALYVLLHDAGRLANLFFWNRPVAKVDLCPPYTNNITIWLQRGLKATILIVGFAIPIYKHVDAQRNYFAKVANQPEYFGQYEVETVKLDGTTLDTSEHQWQSARFAIAGTYTSTFEKELQNQFIVGHDTFKRLVSVISTSEDPGILNFETERTGILPAGKVRLEFLDDNRIQLIGASSRGEIEVTLLRNEGLYRLTGRGYRWINEVPFNR